MIMLKWTCLAMSATRSFGRWFTLVVILAVVVILVIRNIRVVPQASSFIVERLGVYHKTWAVGIQAKIPIIDRVAKVVSLKEKVVDFPPQAVITKDNVTMQMDTVLYYQIVDSRLYAYAIENPLIALENLTATTLRKMTGDLDLDEVFKSRDNINVRMRSVLDEATAHWGVKVNRVELKNMIPPKEIQEAMERQMKAEREKRENILRAEGEKEAAVRVAEGEKEAAILRAEAARQTAICEAEGQAEAILKVQEATARGLSMLQKAGIDQSVIALKSLEALSHLGDGKATKIIIPTDISSLAGLAVTLSDLLRERQAAEQD
jgi:regulator of protease activity HflC (stomatin/prohibitin superfamily)